MYSVPQLEMKLQVKQTTAVEDGCTGSSCMKSQKFDDAQDDDVVLLN